MLKLVQYTKDKLGLDQYTLLTADIYLERSFDSAEPVLSMEWLPPGLEQRLEDETNPPGTAVVEFGIKSRRFYSVIFVEGKTFADQIRFDKNNLEEIVQWVEQETNLTYERQFKLQEWDQHEHRVVFQSSCKDIPVFPSGQIELEMDEAGRLVLFSTYGNFPAADAIAEQEYDLAIDLKIEQLASRQCKLIHFPLSKEEKWQIVYMLEEIYVAQDKQTIIPFEWPAKPGAIIDQLMQWDAPLNAKFEAQPLNMDRIRLSPDQAFSYVYDPDEWTISENEQVAVSQKITDFLRTVFPSDSGKWRLKRMYRNDAYIVAELKSMQDAIEHWHQQKMKVFIDPGSGKVVNYLDQSWLLAAFDHYAKPDKPTISREEAFQRIRPKLELTPAYVYDSKQGKYVMCGKLDCRYGVCADSGELVLLDELA